MRLFPKSGFPKTAVMAGTRYSLLPIAYRLLPVFSLLPIACCLLLLGAPPEQERFSVYAPQARFSLPVHSLDGRDYVGFFELIEPLAAPELHAEGSKWKLRIADPSAPGKTAEAEFQEGSTLARVRGKRIILAAPARSENRRLMLPLHGIGAVLIPLLGTDLIFHEASRRMFLGGAGELISSELHKGDPSTLALHFPEAVSPNINSEGDSLKLSFTRDPVISFTENEPINDKLLSSSTFNESNGAATLTIKGTAPLLAKFADNGKTILVTAAPAPPAAEVVTTAPSIAPAPSVPPIPQPTAAPAIPAAVPATKVVNSIPAFLVVIDAAHGGSDTGARVTPNLPEKEITLSLARRLRQELQSRHIACDLLRDSDTDIALDQRALSANLARASIFVSLHAEPGSNLRIYTAALPSPPTGAMDRNGFLPWPSAQGAFTAESTLLAAAVADSMKKRDLAVQVHPAFVQPLHSIAAPAIAVEAPADSKGLKVSEDSIAGALADAIAARKQNAGAAQ